MPPFLLNFLLAFKKEIIIALVIVGAVVGLYLYHVAAVFEAEQTMKTQRDIYWTNYIKSAPKETLEVRIPLPAPPPKIVTVRDTTVDSTALQIAQDKLDSLAKENASIAAFLKPFGATFTDTLGWATHKVTADVRNRTLTDELSYNPASVPGKQINSIVPVPFKRLSLQATLGGAGDLTVGAAYRLGTDEAFDSPWNNYCIGLGYQVAGPKINNNWYTPIKITITGFIQ